MTPPGASATTAESRSGVGALGAPAGVEAMIDEFRACLRDLGWALRSRLFPDGECSHGQVAAVFEAFAALMERDVAAIEACVRGVQGHAVTKQEDRRDEAVVALRDGLFRVRSLLTASFGPQAVNGCGLDRRVPEQPDALLRYAGRAAYGLERAAASFPEPAPFVSFDWGGAAEYVRERMQALRAVLDADEGYTLRRAEERHAELVQRCMEHRDAALAMIEALAPLVAMGPRAERLRRRSAAVRLATALDIAQFEAPRPHATPSAA